MLAGPSPLTAPFRTVEHRPMSAPRLPLIACGLGVGLSIFTLAEVNHPLLTPLSQLAVFATLGFVLCLLHFPLRWRGKARLAGRALDFLLIGLAIFCGIFLVTQTERALESFWIGGSSLGNRAGNEAALDIVVGAAGLVLVLETTRRTLGVALPLLSLVFLAYAWLGSHFPAWLFPHRGYSLERIVSQTFLQSQGVFGIALSVMFTYVFLFVVFGAFLQATGTTQYVIDTTQRLFRNSPGGPAKVAVVSSGLMGSLSGSAVANTVTTGTFTIPTMRASGFSPQVAAGIEAAASTGGALVPPVMGAGAYMMLEMIDPPVTYLQIIRAALIPALLYYLALFLIVHFYARKIAHRATASASPAAAETPARAETGERHSMFRGVLFAAALGTLVGSMALGYTPSRAVTLALVVVALLGLLHRQTRLTLSRMVSALSSAAREMTPLICAAACVGIVLGVVTLTGIGTRLPAMVLPLAEDNLLSALALIMVASIVLGMGLPSSVCYLLIATLMGPVLAQLGVVPLAAHLFIFYFGMMSMVTPPVALAAYAAASIAGADVMKAGFAAFRFALVGFTLPYIFVYRPELLLLAPAGGSLDYGSLILSLGIAVSGIVAFAAGISGYLFRPLTVPLRIVLFTAAALLLVPGFVLTVAGWKVPVQDLTGFLLLVVAGVMNRRK